MIVSPTAISEQEWRLPGTRTRPLPISPRWTFSRISFSSSMLVGRSTVLGEKEINSPQSCSGEVE